MLTCCNNLTVPAGVLFQVALIPEAHVRMGNEGPVRACTLACSLLGLRPAPCTQGNLQ
jgi:hypothetical protein